MVRNRKFAALILLAGALASACSALTPDDPAATVRAERDGYIAEATNIAQAAQVQGTQVIGTAVAAQTYVAQAEGRNRQLVATLRVAVPPTQQIIENGGQTTPGLLATVAPPGMVIADVTLPAGANPTSAGDTSGSASLGSMQFTQIDTASTVRPADDCADTITRSFPADVQRIYITTRVLNAAQGTAVRVEWNYAGQLAHTENYTIPRDDDDFCMWFFIEPTADVFSPGNWSVSLTANGQTLDPPAVNFTIG